MPDPIVTNNSRERAVTTNYFDKGKRYAYQINKDHLLDFRIDSGDWKRLALPQDVRITNVAADNNRVFVRTSEDKLYWRVLKEDSANWVVLLLQLAKLFGNTALKEALWSQIAGNGNDDKTWIEDQHFTDLASWAAAYLDWVPVTHNPDRPAPPSNHPYLKEQGWNSLEQRALPLPQGYTIGDIAVGHWNNTVVTYYVLAHVPTASGHQVTSLFFLDEEPIMHAWDAVPDQESLALDRSSRISASHSVVAAITGNKRPNRLDWMRIDAHRPGHVDIWPLNWTESWTDQLTHAGLGQYLPSLFPGENPPIQPSPQHPLDWLLFIAPFDVLNVDNYPKWHSVSVDVETVSGFIIDVGYGRRPWPVPKPGDSPRLPLLELLKIFSALWWINILVTAYSAVLDAIRGKPEGKDVGFLGDNPIRPNCAYPVCCIVESGNRHLGFAISDARKTGRIKWTDDVHVCQRCARQKDLGYSECAKTEDQGYRDCCDWIPCKWFCDAWVWISHVVCVLWVWVSNVVCVLWE